MRSFPIAHDDTRAVNQQFVIAEVQVSVIQIASEESHFYFVFDSCSIFSHNGLYNSQDVRVFYQYGVHG